MFCLLVGFDIAYLHYSWHVKIYAIRNDYMTAIS